MRNKAWLGKIGRTALDLGWTCSTARFTGRTTAITRLRFKYLSKERHLCKKNTNFKKIVYPRNDEFYSEFGVEIETRRNKNKEFKKDGFGFIAVFTLMAEFPEGWNAGLGRVLRND